MSHYDKQEHLWKQTREQRGDALSLFKNCSELLCWKPVKPLTLLKVSTSPLDCFRFVSFQVQPSSQALDLSFERTKKLRILKIHTLGFLLLFLLLLISSYEYCKSKFPSFKQSQKKVFNSRSHVDLLPVRQTVVRFQQKIFSWNFGWN